ncbi:hypothetical protein GCM10027169_22720 [Gordonia jinhuaensis]|uniref:Transcription regulator of the Arc/MetJ class n=1 Tax=Gordonia jinhuaensis TaxID=1517702 RepID=A0A916WZ53_9ACTN|nr:type II toxin-antitoxin system VapB family antitoxin [Gordonia jinhuaensis]GGB41345.1 hypothetical protein GCM10011489_31170 [Gordonia jinhuaensis]
MIFRGVRDGKPYPDHGLTHRDWAKIPPRQFRLDELTTVTTVLALDRLLSEDSTFYGDLFAHAVRWHGEIYLEDGLHRAVRSALRNRNVIHARMLDLDAVAPGQTASESLADLPIARPAELTPPIDQRPESSAPPRRPAAGRGWSVPGSRRPR